MSISPREHQQQGIDKAIEYFKNHDRGVLHYACGTGKTLMSWWLSEKLKARRIIIQAPTLQLLSQTLETWQKAMIDAKINMPIILLGSDNTIKGDTNIVITTDQSKLNDFLKTNESCLVITTYHSNHLLSNQGHSFDLAIYDEAHETAGLLDKFANTLIHNDVININKRLFLTATPKNINLKEDKLSVLSMDNVDIYGEVINKYSVREAINDGILSDYRVLIVGCLDESVKDLGFEIKGMFDGDVFREYDIYSAFCYAKEIKKLGLKKLISFHATNGKAKMQYSLMKRIAYGFDLGIDLKVFYIDHKHNNKERKKILEQFEQCEYGILYNCKILHQGYDLPILDGIIIGDKTKSTTGIVQKHGRAIRKAEGKEFGYILLPVQSEEDAHEKGFETIMMVLAALANEDDQLKHEIKQLKTKESDPKKGTIIQYSDKFIRSQKLWDALKITFLKSWNYSEGRSSFLNLKEWRLWIANNKSEIWGSSNKYRVWCRLKQRPPFIPYSPNVFYNKSWNDLWNKEKNSYEFIQVCPYELKVINFFSNSTEVNLMHGSRTTALIRRKWRNGLFFVKGFYWVNKKHQLKLLKSRHIMQRSGKVKPIINVTNMVLYNSSFHVREAYDLSTSQALATHLRGKRKTYLGYKWQYLEDYEKEHGKLSEEEIERLTWKPELPKT